MRFKKELWHVSLLLIILLLILWFSPMERTLGSTIRYVYLHVALIWCGMVGMTLMAVLGVGYVFWRHEFLDHWRQMIGWVTLFTWFFAIAISTVAAKIAWGSVSWSEPLIVVAFVILVSLLVVQSLGLIIYSSFIRGLVGVFPIGLMIVLSHQVPRIIHPDNPIKYSDYLPIKLTFYALFLICLSLSGWLVWGIGRERNSICKGRFKND